MNLIPLTEGWKIQSTSSMKSDLYMSVGELEAPFDAIEKQHLSLQHALV